MLGYSLLFSLGSWERLEEGAEVEEVVEIETRGPRARVVVGKERCLGCLQALC